MAHPRAPLPSPRRRWPAYRSSTLANWLGIAQTRLTAKLTDDEFVNTNPDIGAGRAGEAWYPRISLGHAA